MTTIPILIVGAGPVGLTMACELSRRNIPFRIIDKKSEPSKGSNATWIQSRTLEILNLMEVIDPFIEKGNPCEAINFYLKGNNVGTLPLSSVNSLYPFILMLPQSETEKILLRKLAESKIRIERSSELIDIKQKNNKIISTIRLPNNNLETITSNWLVACDGANSTVRKQCNIRFPGGDIPEQFMVADAKMNSFLPTNEIHVFFDEGTIFPEKGTLFSAFPWGEMDYRLSANLYLDSPRLNFTEQEVREIVAERTYGNFIVNSVSWISPFWIHSKTVRNMQHGPLFLVGDAAHIHSPAGGQGMNTGIQDAFNLAWKLALAIKNKPKKSVLESYQLERYPVVNKIVKQSDKFTNMMLFDKKFISKLKQFTKHISHFKDAKKIATQLTQLDIRYQKSPIIDYTKKTPAKSPKQGQRAPDVPIDDSRHLYDYFHNTHFNILLFTGLDKKPVDIVLLKKFNKIFPKFVKVHIVTPQKVKGENVIPDNNSNVHNQYNIKTPSIYVIRPDNYICYFSSKIDIKALERFLKKYLFQ